MNEKEDTAFIMHILDSIAAIERFSKNLTREKLESNRLKQSAIVREIEIIGEAVKNLSEKLRRAYPEVEWRNIVGTRDKMIHHYFGIDLDIIWGIVQKDLPILKKRIKSIQESLEKKS